MRTEEEIKEKMIEAQTTLPSQDFSRKYLEGYGAALKWVLSKPISIPDDEESD